jgi:hypothetical protein
MDGWNIIALMMDGWTDGWIDEWMDGSMDALDGWM